MSQFKGVATGGNREKYTRREHLTYASIALLILGMLVLYAFEIEYFGRYTNPSLFVIIALVGGLLFGIGIAYFFRKIAKSPTETMQLYVVCIVTSLIFSPLIFSLTNRLFALKKYSKEVQIVKIDKQISARFGIEKGQKVVPNMLKVIYVDEGKEFNFTTKKMTLVEVKNGDIVDLVFKKGLLGFEYIYAGGVTK